MPSELSQRIPSFSTASVFGASCASAWPAVASKTNARSSAADPISILLMLIWTLARCAARCSHTLVWGGFQPGGPAAQRLIADESQWWHGVTGDITRETTAARQNEAPPRTSRGGVDIAVGSLSRAAQ